MSKHEAVAKLVRDAYQSSQQEFARWIWNYHVPVVAQKTTELSQRFGADADIAVAGAWLHDFGDAFVDRFDPEHEHISQEKGQTVLLSAGYSAVEMRQVFNEVISPHSCKDRYLPTSIEGKVMATADALAHLTTDFYLQFAWRHLPEGKSYLEFRQWVEEKLERDFKVKIFFDEVKNEVKHRYEMLKEVFANND